MLNLQNINAAKLKLGDYNPANFTSSRDSFTDYLYKIHIGSFRHINNLDVEFLHPVSIISGTNKIGKTSLLLLIAGSYVNFKKYDSTKPETVLRNHVWGDVLHFTGYETTHNNYSYKLFWRKGTENREGEGKRLASSKAWTGLAKYSSDSTRMNAKIRDREVRLIDLERINPARNFSNSLYRKISQIHTSNRVHEDIEKSFAFVLGLDPGVQIFRIGSHINKIAYLIKEPGTSGYSSYNAASGEESLINILCDIFDTPNNSLIIIDELEAGFHPTIQKRLADLFQYISWSQKKQFIITTHSPILMGAFPQKSRIFIDKKNNGSYESIKKISVNAAYSRMDSDSHPLINIYCEDDLAKFILQNLLIEINDTHKGFNKLCNIITSGPVNQVQNDYTRHKRNYPQLKMKIGYCGIFDGDYKDDPKYSSYHENPDEFTFFLYPYVAPEKFLVKSYLNSCSNADLERAYNFNDHHSLFQEMVNLGLATDASNARDNCWEKFKVSPEYSFLKTKFTSFILNIVIYFSEKND